MRLLRAGRQRPTRGRVELQRIQPPASDAVSYLLDEYPAFAAYSTRQLRTGEVDCMDVREATGDAIATIGFADGWLDEAALATHCSGANGFVSKWYDQSGNGYDATNATTAEQPQIYNGSAVLKVNSNPSLTKVTTATNLKSTFASQSQPDTIFSVANYLGVSSKVVHGGTDGSNECQLLNGTGNSQINAGTSLTAAAPTPGQLQHTVLFNGTSSLFRRNGTQVSATGNAGAEPTNGLIIGNWFNKTLAMDGVQEIVYYNSDQSANFAAIEADETTAFAFPASDDFSGTGTNSGSVTDQNFGDRWTITASGTTTLAISAGDLVWSGGTGKTETSISHNLASMSSGEFSLNDISVDVDTTDAYLFWRYSVGGVDYTWRCGIWSGEGTSKAITHEGSLKATYTTTFSLRIYWNGSAWLAQYNTGSGWTTAATHGSGTLVPVSLKISFVSAGAAASALDCAISSVTALDGSGDPIKINF